MRTVAPAARPRRHGGDDDDIRDPIGQPLAVHEEVGESITGALLPVLDRIVKLRPTRVPNPPG